MATKSHSREKWCWQPLFGTGRVINNLLGLDADCRIVRWYRSSWITLGHMRFFCAIAALILTVWLTAEPVSAACFSDSEHSTSASVSQSDQLNVLVAGDAHCQHIPCSNSGHSHASSGCGGHSFVSLFPHEPLKNFNSMSRIGFSNESITGLTLLPPVPPPLG